MAQGLGAFVSARGSAELQGALEGLPALPTGAGPGGGAEPACLVAGPPGSGKTSVLFHCAHAAAASGGTALVVASRGALEARLPLLPEGSSPDDTAWDRVQLRYLEEPGEIERFAASVHLLEGPQPEVLLVDDVDARLPATGPRDGHLKKATEMALVRRMAHLHEACRALSARLPGERTCRLVVSATSGGVGTEDPVQELYIYRRWTPLVLRLQPAAAWPGSFELSVLPTDLTRGHDVCSARVRYSLALGSHVRVEEVLRGAPYPDGA